MPPSSKPKPSVQSLGRIGDARLDLVPKLADCAPGIQPIEYNVVVAPVPATEVEGKIGSIFIPDEAKETLDLAMQVGRIIAMSALAFNYDKWPEGTKPEVGQMVWFARYGGKEFEGRDGKMYRILKDKDIGAIVPEEPVGVSDLVVEAGGCAPPVHFTPMPKGVQTLDLSALNKLVNQET